MLSAWALPCISRCLAMKPPGFELAVLSVFAVIGLPLALQDVKHREVSTPASAGSLAAWSVFSFLVLRNPRHPAVAVLVLLLGALLLTLFPGRLGEADVVFISGMALLMPFWPLMCAVGLACVSGLCAYVWLSWRYGTVMMSEPIPFLPSLYWGGLAVMVGGIVM